MNNPFKKNKIVEQGEEEMTCSVCLYAEYDCVCHHDDIDAHQFVGLGKNTKRIVSEIRKDEKKNKGS